MDDAEYEQIENTIIFIAGALFHYQQWGFVVGGNELLPKGLAAFDQLEASGWRPHFEDVRESLDCCPYFEFPERDRDIVADFVCFWDEAKRDHAKQDA